METIIKIAKCFVFGILLVTIVPYIWINFVLIGLKWVIRGVRSGWTIDEMKTETDREREEFLSHFNKKVETL